MNLDQHFVMIERSQNLQLNPTRLDARRCAFFTTIILSHFLTIQILARYYGQSTCFPYFQLLLL